MRSHIAGTYRRHIEAARRNLCNIGCSEGRHGRPHQPMRIRLDQILDLAKPPTKNISRIVRHTTQHASRKLTP